MRDFSTEFRTIEILEQSDAATRGVDSFALAIIKVERQLRKLFTFLIFQYPSLRAVGVPTLRDLLYSKRIYSSGMIQGINEIAPKSIKELIGVEHDVLFGRLGDATEIRNKIFHGQVTDQHLSRSQLFEYVHFLRQWCSLLAVSAEAEFGYDGFGSNSYRQSADQNFVVRLKRQINSLDDYAQLLDVLKRVPPL